MIDEAKKNQVSESNGVDPTKVVTTKPNGEQSVEKAVEQDNAESESSDDEEGREEEQEVGNVGLDFDIEFRGGQAVVTLKHRGSAGYANLQAGIDALPFVNKIIDIIEEKIPGDQKMLASSLKKAVANLEF